MISVILCHHKGDLINKAIESLQKQRFVKTEIIVATSEEGREFPGTKTIFVKGGPAHKRNIASRFAQGDYFAFFDDDIEADRDALYQMSEGLTRYKCGMVFGKLLNMEHHDRLDEAGSYLTWTGFLWARAESGKVDYGQYECAEPVLAGKSAACMVRRKVFREVSGFDPTYEILGEETDLAWRIWLWGYNVFYIPQSITYHAFNTKFKPADFYVPRRVYFNGSRNYLSMLITNLEKLNLIVPVLVHCIVWPTAAIGLAITGKREAAANIFHGLWWVITHWKYLLFKRRHVQSHRRVPDKSLFPLIRRNPPCSYYIGRLLRYIRTGIHG